LGLTGTTGLAGGDHLHFSVLIHGDFVNPTEWWDAHWLKDQVEKVWVQASTPAAATGQQAKYQAVPQKAKRSKGKKRKR
jgi:hypothetical protein